MRVIIFKLNIIISSIEEVDKINFPEYEFKQNIKKLIKKFKNEFNEEIIENIELIDYFQQENPIKSIKINSFIDGKSFYSNYLSKPRSKSIHEAKIEENFKNEIIEKNQIHIWLKAVQEFVNKIEKKLLIK